MSTVVFDIGGTKTRVALAKNGDIGEPVIIQTPETPKEGLEEIIRIARDVALDDEIMMVVGGVAGIVVEGCVYRAPNLPLWDGACIEEELREALGAPVYVRNDAALAALGEAHYGAGKGSAIMAYVTVSTGVNGAKIEEGKLDDYTYGFEIGHQIINGAELQDLISGTAVRERFHVEPKDLTDESSLNTLAEELALGLYNLTLHWSPDTIVLGGSMIVGKNAIPLSLVHTFLTERVEKYYPESPIIKSAELKDLGGLWGAKAYSLQMIGTTEVPLGTTEQ